MIGYSAQVTGFSDKAAALLANAASTDWTRQHRSTRFKAQLSSDLLTDGQRGRLTTQLAKLEVPASITETFRAEH